MPSKPRFVCMDKDDAVWQQLDGVTDKWYESIRTDDTCQAVGNFILTHRNGQAEVMHRPVRGGYNVIYRLEYSDGSSAVMRIPIKGIVPFPDEKVRYEAATMRYVAANTNIPVPRLYHYGTGAENPTGLGPFLIMDYIDHYQNMSRELLDPERPAHERPVLDPQISEEKLEFLYAQMANILLQLFTLKFPRIGSLVEDEADASVSVKGRPLIANMNDIVVHTNAPPGILPSRVYNSTEDWYSELADMHMAQLAFQIRDAVEDEDDARDKYTARQLFRNLATDKRLMPHLSGPDGGFRLFSEDFRPANVLLDKDLRVVGVIDWEFAYAAPSQFSFDPPWWLLLEEPDSWKGGCQPWMEVYEPRLQTFLRVLEAEEKKMAPDLADKINGLTLTDGGEAEPLLSQRMRESWQKRTWMVNYAARKSWAFDFVWWKFLDESYFGPNEDQDYQPRVKDLSEPQRGLMESFVARKMEESSSHQAKEWGEKDSRDHLAELLV